MTLAGGDLMAAESSAQPIGEAPYITVQFDNGPASAVLVEVEDDDFCDPKFWRFQEVHQKRPCAKVLFDDGDVLFADSWPSAEAGVLVDEDGDAHHYLRASSPVSSALAPLSTRRKRIDDGVLPLAAVAATHGTEGAAGTVLPHEESVVRRGRACWGHYVAEKIEADEMEEPRPRVKRKPKQQGDEDWGARRRGAQGRRARRRCVEDGLTDRGEGEKGRSDASLPHVDQGGDDSGNGLGPPLAAKVDKDADNCPRPLVAGADGQGGGDGGAGLGPPLADKVGEDAGSSQPALDGGAVDGDDGIVPVLAVSGPAVPFADRFDGDSSGSDVELVRAPVAKVSGRAQGVSKTFTFDDDDEDL
mmetsp:Transcript_13160/g.35233  ORF Transcript_13160/g.35233 Transcript_13160/m.35233 type:complete len:359 (-) Transcript_13160:134-1210(-)